MRRAEWAVAVGVCVAVSVAGCGKKKKSDDTPTDTTGLTSDSEATTSVIAQQLDETASALNAGDGSANVAASAGLVGDDAKLVDGVSRTRTCTADAGTKAATVTLTYDGSGSATVGKATTTETAGGTETRTWTNANNAVVCTDDAQYARIAWRSAKAIGAASGFDGLMLSDGTKRTRVIKTDVVTAKGATKTRTASTSENGTRTVKWSGTTPAATMKTITLDVAKTYDLTRFDGTKSDLGGELHVDAASPLVIQTTRDEGGVPQTHTVQSGTIALTKTGSFYVTTSFTNVLYNLGGTDPCVPVSGQIVTSVYDDPTATKAVGTVTTTFAVGGATIVGDDTATDDLKNSFDTNCDLKGGD